jgi:hypothetical protein
MAYHAEHAETRQSDNEEHNCSGRDPHQAHILFFFVIIAVCH